MKKEDLIKEYKFLWKNINNNIDFIPRSIKECNRDIDFSKYDFNKFEIFDAFYNAIVDTHAIPSYKCNLPNVRKKRIRLLKSIEQFCECISSMTIDEINEVKLEEYINKNKIVLLVEKVSSLIDLYGEYEEKEKELLLCFATGVIKHSSMFAEHYQQLRLELFPTKESILTEESNHSKDEYIVIQEVRPENTEGSHSPA